MCTERNRIFSPAKWLPNGLIAAIFCGVILGQILTVSTAFVFMAALMFLAYYFVRRTFEDTVERAFITRVFLVGLILRIVICSGLYFFNEFRGSFYHFYGYRGNCILGDSAFASVNGLWIAQYWAGQLKMSDIHSSFFQNINTINPYFYAVFYTIFGFKELSAKYIDVVLGAVSPVFVYLATKRLFDKRAAKIAYLLTMFFPSMILWSVTNLKETKQIFLSVVIFYLITIKMGAVSRLRNLIFFTICFCAFFYIRGAGASVFLLSAALGFYIEYDIPLRRKALFAAALALAAASALFLGKGIDVKELLTVKACNLMGAIIANQKGIFMGQGINYKIYCDAFYTISTVTPEMLRHYHFSFFDPFVYLFKGCVYFLFTPFPWSITSVNQLLWMPQILIWYLLFAFSLVGLWRVFCEKRLKAATLVLLIVILTVSAGLVSGNIGTSFRHRDLIIPFYLILTAFGITKMFPAKKREGGAK